MFFFVALLVVGLFLIYRLRVGYPPAEHSVLSRGESAFVSAAATSFFPPAEGLALDGASADLPGYADRYLAQLPVRQQRLIRALFVLFEQATLLFPAQGVGAFRRFSAMAPEQRDAYLRGWADSRLYLRRTAFVALKAVLVLGYVGHDENLAALGMPAWEIEPVVVEADLLYPPIGRPRAEVRHSSADLSPEAARPPLSLEAERL